jgi:hypothetical protein
MGRMKGYGERIVWQCLGKMGDGIELKRGEMAGRVDIERPSVPFLKCSPPCRAPDAGDDQEGRRREAMEKLEFG